MKKFILFFALLVSVNVCNAQIVTIIDESFEKPLSGWVITPSATWEADTNLYVGGHTSYHGYIPIGNSGDTVILTSPLFDLKSYGYAYLTFNQICKVSGSDICRIEYRENTMGATWKAIPRSSYKGNGIYTNDMFNEGSYNVDWRPGDSLAIPSNSWWKTEQFDISNEVSFAEVQFRFKITKGSVIGTQISFGWLIDNFKLTASANPIAPPLVELISNYGDTVNNTGPFEIKAKVISRTYAQILSPKLYYSATLNNITTHDSVNMTALEGDSIWTANIRQYQFETFISFSVLGSDSVGNNNSINGGFYLSRPKASITGYFIVGTDTSITTNSPLTSTSQNSWSRMLFLSNEISQNGLGGIITKLAWQVKAAEMFYMFQTCYFRMVDDVNISSGTYEDPISAGATLVWSGNINLTKGWCEINLTTPFVLMEGKNLLVYWHNKHGAGANTQFNCTKTSLYQTVSLSGSTFPGGTGSFSYDRPNARFYVVGYYNYSNSVSLHEINNPQSTVLVNPSSNIPIVVTLKNKGIVNLDSCYIDWTLNGIPQSRHIWRGNLADDFNATDTIGYFSPAANQYDTILAWVSMPNGVYDSTSYDDTILRITYGISGLDMDFITSYEDSVYTTGPFPIQAHIASRTLAAVPAPINLYVKYTNNGIDNYDTLLMDSMGNNIYEAIIPQHSFGTDVKYSILLYDSLHNSVSISDRLYIKRREAGKTGYVIVGSDTILYPSPMYMSYGYAWTRQVYLSHEISPSSAGGIITKLAWDYTYGTPHALAVQSCYFRVVDDDNIPLSTYEDPVTAGATLVWSGTISLTKGWSEINLTTPFILPPIKIC